MLLVGDSAELWLRAGWRVRATVHGAVSGSTQLVLEVCELELPNVFDLPTDKGSRENTSFCLSSIKDMKEGVHQGQWGWAHDSKTHHVSE